MAYFDVFISYMFLLQTIFGIGLQGELRRHLAFTLQVNQSGSGKNEWLQMSGCIWLMFCPPILIASFLQRGVYVFYRVVCK